MTLLVRLCFFASWRIEGSGPEVEGTADSGGTSEGEYLMLLLIKDATEASPPPIAGALHVELILTTEGFTETR